MAVDDTEAAVALAEELGWGRPHGDDVDAFVRLLNDECERLGTKPRLAFAEQIRVKCADALGPTVLVCEGCQQVVLSRYRPDDGRCRVCSAPLSGSSGDEEVGSGFGFVLSEYSGGGAASVVNPAAGPDVQDVWDLAGGRIARKLQLDAENGDWDEMADEVEAAREKAAREKAAREKAEREEREAREAAERAEREKTRPAFGCVLGDQTGKIVRIADLPDDGPGEETAVFVSLLEDGTEQARLYMMGGDVHVDGVAQSLGIIDLDLGQTLRMGEMVFVIEETQEMDGIVAEAVHFARDDKKPGGPWAYWNDEVNVGASGACQVNVVDDAVADVHARILTRFGQVVIEDLSPGDGLFVDGRRRESFVLTPGLVFTLGETGPPLKVNRGEAKQKAGKAARAMKPSRHNRTVFELTHKNGKLLRKVFVFTRREVRFGSRSRSAEDDSRLINELTLIPTGTELTVISEKQGGLCLTRDGVEIRRDGEEVMYFDGEEMEPGKPQSLKRRFAVSVGDPEDGVRFDGRIYRSPTSIARDDGPARLGMKGGHPTECVRLDRKGTKHTYVFLVRMMRIGSEPAAPLRLGLPGVAENHCRIMFSQGKFLIAAPKEGATVFLGNFECEAGVIYPLEINTSIAIGDARLLFRVVDDGDFLPE